MFFKNKTFRNVILSVSLLISVSLPIYAEIDSNSIKEIKKISDSINLAKGEYSECVENGKVIKEEEYDEANLFLKEAVKRINTLEKHIKPKDKLSFLKVRENINSLENKIKNKVDSDDMSKQVLLSDHNLELLSGTTLKELPLKKLSFDNGKKVFIKNCSVCHGITGLGNGSAAKGMKPPPVNFHTEIINEVSPYNFYRAIKNGISGTAMPSWESQLSLQEKWDVINYIRNLDKKENNKKYGLELYTKYSKNISLKKLENIVESVDKSNLMIISELKKDKQLANLKDEKLLNLIEYIRNEKTNYSQANSINVKIKKGK